VYASANAIDVGWQSAFTSAIISWVETGILRDFADSAYHLKKDNEEKMRS
jgi:hypothetical protein